jgi:RNA polymerase sigma-70 factor (ECF subfamily)
MMLSFKAERAPDLAGMSENELVGLARAGNSEAVRCIIQTYNRRLYRVARAVLHDDTEAEDVVQETYMRAFSALASFRHDSSLATWLTRIALNEALGRLRRSRPTIALDALDSSQERERMRVIPFPLLKPESDPEQTALRHEVRRLLERAIDELPEPFRIVFVFRDVEEMTVEETAQMLGLRAETVRTRLHRARAQLRKTLDSQLVSALADTFPFGGTRCARLTEAIVQRLATIRETETTKEDKQ